MADMEREGRYANAVGLANNADTRAAAVQRVMAVANEEQQAVASENERLCLEVEQLRHALHDVVDLLGPDRICDCGPNVECWLREEAADALRAARSALGLD